MGLGIRLPCDISTSARPPVALMNNSGADPHAAIELYGREVFPEHRIPHLHSGNEPECV